MSALSSRLSLSDRRDRDDSPEGRNPSRPSGQASKSFFVLRDSAFCQTAAPSRLTADKMVISSVYSKSPSCVRPQRGVSRTARVTSSLKRCRLPLCTQAHNYLSSTLAPTFSRAALIFSASSFGMPSLTGFGAASTRSLASFRPRPVAARTSLITSIFLSPIAASTTVNSVFSSTGAAAAPPGAAATATAAAADTPHFSSSILASSAASSTVRLDRSVTIFCRSAISLRPIGSNQSRLRRALRRLALVGISRHNASDFRRGRVDDLGNLGRRRLDEADDLGPQLVERRQRSECLDAVLVERGLAHRPAQDHELLVCLGEVGGDLCRSDRIARIGDHGRPLQQGDDRGCVSAVESDLGEPVLGDLHRRARLLHLPAQVLHLGHREARILSDDHDVGALEDTVERRDELFLSRSIHSKLFPVWRL